MQQSDVEGSVARLAKAAPAQAWTIGLELLRADRAEDMLPTVRRIAARNRADGRMQQLLGLAARTAQDGEIALTAFRRASELLPGDPLIAHSHARAALEAGQASIDLFDLAIRLSPADGSILLGRAAALLDLGRGEDAVAELGATLASNPSWHDGHRGFARLAAAMGRSTTHSIDSALESNPSLGSLHHHRIAILMEEGRHADALSAIGSARGAMTEDPFALIECHCLSELGETKMADAVLEQVACRSAPDAAMLARHHLRAARPEQALRLLEPFAGRDPQRQTWPYLALAWRLLDDERWHWLAGDERFVRSFDLGDAVGDFGKLAEHLRNLHRAKGEPLDQSVRGGTQTDGNLLLRLDPPIRKLREAVLAAVDRYVEDLPPSRAGHPTLIERRCPRRIAGSWSVRLRDAGHHVDHVHSQGWLSSAFYAGLPDHAGDDPHAGWLSLGESRDLVPGLGPVRLIEPKVGRLVLFPSVMWHGTRPFQSGERLTMAFDIALPQQS